MARTARKKAAAKPLTTAQRLDSIIKSARKMMRKDKGLNGDLDRLPMLTWIMFLKFLDDLERIEEERADLAGTDYRPIIEPPYRWRDWAAQADGITGPDLLSFLTAEQAERPDGTRGPGLFAYLRNLRGDNGRRERRDVIAIVFQGFTNRMESGYLLRDVVNLIDGIHFDSSEEVHTLGRLYETLLREMRDAAGDSGEFYTPRPVVRFMVKVMDPQLSETVLDPACGTGGFLTEAFQHLERQADTVEKHQILQESSIFGGEAKSLPFLLSQLNLLLHGLHAPRIDPGNALRFRLAEIGEDQRVNVILTNPPFGGEEETGILNNFPEDRRTAETALLFLQLKKLFRIEPGDLLFNIVFAWEGAVAIAQLQDHGRVGSHRFLTCVPDPEIATADFLLFYFLTRKGLERLVEASPGGAGRNRTLGLKKLEAIEVPVPPLTTQRWFDHLQAKAHQIRTIRAGTGEDIDALIPAILDEVFNGRAQAA